MRKALCNCGQLSVTYEGPDPDRPDVSAANDFRLRGVWASVGDDRLGPSDAGRASRLAVG